MKLLLPFIWTFYCWPAILTSKESSFSVLPLSKLVNWAISGQNRSTQNSNCFRKRKAKSTTGTYQTSRCHRQMYNNKLIRIDYGTNADLWLATCRINEQYIFSERISQVLHHYSHYHIWFLLYGRIWIIIWHHACTDIVGQRDCSSAVPCTLLDNTTYKWSSNLIHEILGIWYRTMNCHN